MAVHEYPFHREGYMLEGIYRWMKPEDFEWRPNAPFKAEMTLDKYYLGDRAKFFVVDTATEIRYPMFASEFMRLFEALAWVGTTTKPLTWHAAKRGSAYAIVALDA